MEALLVRFANVSGNVIRSQKSLQTGQDRNPYREHPSALVKKPWLLQPELRKQSIVDSFSGIYKRLIQQISA